MNSSTLFIDKNSNNVYNLFLPEINVRKKTHTECSIKKTDAGIQFDITANDNAHIKAYIKSINNIVETYNKIERLYLENGRIK